MSAGKVVFKTSVPGYQLVHVEPKILACKVDTLANYVLNTQYLNIVIILQRT